MADGIIIIDKPAGWTSMDVCGKLRGILKTKKVGHAGTLDPMATGVLPVFVGNATRAVSYAEGGDKEYVAGLRLGLTTNTQDTTGEVVAERPVSVTQAQLEDVLARFTGEIDQVPPMYSAIKINGQKLYQLARKGQEIERPPRRVTIHELALLEPEERARIKGLLINKFRGDVEILRPGLAMLEEKTQLPVLGVVPYLKVDIEDEDSLSTRLNAGKTVHPLDAAILRLPHISNFTDFMPLEQHPLLGVRYVKNTRQLGTPDLIILPGTKNTVDDLLWLRQSGLEAALLKLAANGTPVLGVCGGYQMLGETLADPEGTESGTAQTVRGLGLLPTRTVFTGQKHRTQDTAAVTAAPFAGAALTGYQIHTGRTEVQGVPFCTLADGTPEGCVQDNVFGTYLHGLFDTGELTEKLVALLCRRKGIAPDSAALIPMEQYRQQQFDLLADGVRGALDLDAVYAAMGLENPRRNAQ